MNESNPVHRKSLAWYERRNDPFGFSCHAAATLYMTGLIWFVQVVHYPLMGLTGKAEFSAYEQRHTLLTTWVVAPNAYRGRDGGAAALASPGRRVSLASLGWLCSAGDLALHGLSPGALSHSSFKWL